MRTNVLTKVGFARILVATDFSEISYRAFDYAKAVAKLHGSDLLLVHVTAPLNSAYVPEGEWFVESSEMRRAEQELEQQCADLRTDGLNAAAKTLVGATTEEIVEAAAGFKSDLIVVGTHGRKGFERLLFGSDAESLLRKSPCAVLIVGPNAKPSRPGQWDPERIVFATSLNPDAAPMAVFTALLAEQLSASFTIFHIENAAQFEQNYDVVEFQEAFSRLLPGKQLPHYSLHAPVSSEHFGSAIVDFAKRTEAGFIAMGAFKHGSALSHFSRGTVSVVAGEASCPVLVFPHASKV
jgi:nucleotide-binding universal stress UspA family protein